MVGVLSLAYGIRRPEATTIVLVDRVISVFSIIVIGSILYVVSGKPKGAGLSQPVEATRARGLTGLDDRARPRPGTRVRRTAHARTARDRTRPPRCRRGRTRV